MNFKDLGDMCPGIVIAQGTYGPTVYISDHVGEVGKWTFEQIAANPYEWEKCITLLMVAAKMGPHAARAHLNDQRRDDPNEAQDGTSMVCNICNEEFVMIPGKYHRVAGEFGGKNYCEYQCSQECNQQRVKELMTRKCGEGLIQQIALRMAQRQL